MRARGYNWARKRALIDCANPVVGGERPRVKEIVDFLTLDEAIALLITVADALAVLHTAARDGEQAKKLRKARITLLAALENDR